MQRDPPQISLTAELLEASPPMSPEVSPRAVVGSVEESVDMTLAVLHKTYIQNGNLQRVLGESSFPAGFMASSLLDKVHLLESLTTSLCSLLVTYSPPPSQSFKFNTHEKTQVTLAISSHRPDPSPPLLNRILDMPDSDLVLKPEETKQLAGLIFGAIRDSSSEVYKKQVGEMQERMAVLGEDLLRCKERLRAKEELILGLELKLAGKARTAGGEGGGQEGRPQGRKVDGNRY